MPEGPEIHRAADQIAAAIAGERAVLVHFGLPKLYPWEAQLTGATVTAVEARGKAILTRFDLGYAVYSHNQLYGKWYVRGAGLYPKTGRSLRMEIQTEHRSALLGAQPGCPAPGSVLCQRPRELPSVRDPLVVGLAPELEAQRPRPR